MKYQLGDEVQIKPGHDGPGRAHYFDYVGTITHIGSGPFPYGVKFPNSSLSLKFGEHELAFADEELEADDNGKPLTRAQEIMRSAVRGEAKQPAEDVVNHPSHYTCFSNGSEVVDIVEHLTFNAGNAVKYLARAGRKTEDPRTDLLKAHFYVRREIARLGIDH
ncbi:DUF3310 domain-containing protein [Streptomyces sp. 769]|uniref:DUF3310 domain-containing protein n=1 Tax=Streptomyces sp. 769 TaxID=1262452 RepID=UPI000582212C|nr:DUF3310 domain-containing protein [Streptomyces sp. 769]AJC53971.1 hypothetical protein GZL_01371 [Streptomyces sp. 769]